jgi:hypothetical protein
LTSSLATFWDDGIVADLHQPGLYQEQPLPTAESIAKLHSALKAALGDEEEAADVSAFLHERRALRHSAGFNAYTRAAAEIILQSYVVAHGAEQAVQLP